jgi:hypothetical protein
VVVHNIQQHLDAGVVAGGRPVDASHCALEVDRLPSSSRGVV